MNITRASLFSFFLFIIALSLTGSADTPQWIWHDNKGHAIKTREVCFLRKTFHLDSIPTKASLRVAADDDAIVYLNGHEVAHSAGYDKPASEEVTNHLRK